MHRARLVAPLLVVGLAVAACSGSGSGAGTYGGYGAPAAATATAAPATAAAVAVASSPPSAAASTAGADGYDSGYSKGGGGTGSSAGAPAVKLASTGLGPVLVDGKGMTLYLFTPDTAMTSACTGGCATNWPPLTGGAPTVGAGLEAFDFGMLARADGASQVTFHGHPLYTFGGDSGVGQTNGQGVGGKWYALGADGNPIK